MALLTITRVHARSFAAPFLLQIRLIHALQERREASRVSFLMCPFCVRAALTNTTTVGRSRRGLPVS